MSLKSASLFAVKLAIGLVFLLFLFDVLAGPKNPGVPAFAKQVVSVCDLCQSVGAAFHSGSEEAPVKEVEARSRKANKSK